MKLESEREQDPSLDSARLPSTHGENRCREILRRHPADFHDLYRLFAKPPYEPLFGIADPLSRLLSAEGIERTRPLERVSLGFIQESAEQCALLAERWGACWGRWMNHFGESALVEWEREIPKLLTSIDEDTLKRQPELVFVDPAWLPSGSSELVQAHSLFAEESQSLFLTMRNTGITPLTPGLRMAIENWGVCAYGLVQKCHPILLEGWSDQQRAAIDSIVDILARYDQHRLLPTAFLNMKPDHLGEHAAIFLEAIMIDPAKTCTILEHFPITERQSVRDLALDTIRYCGPAAEEVLVRLGDPRDEFVEQLDLLIRHSGVFGERALHYRRPQEWERRRDEWRSALHQYGHAFWALSAKFRGNVLDMILEHRSFIDQVFPLCAGGTGKFLHLLPLSLWSSDGAALADRFRESAGDVWEALREDAFEWVGGNRHSDLGSVLLQKGRIRAIHRYLARDKTGDVRFDPLKVVAELLHADKRRVIGKKSALLVSAGTDPRNTFGGSHMARIFHDLLERFDLTVHEARSKSEASESLGALHKRIEGAPLSLRVVAAHGDSFGMQFGGLRHMLPCPADGTQISRENYLSIRDRELVRSWNRHFGPESDLVVLSCSNFSKAQDAGGFGQMLQEELAPARVFGMRWNMTPLSIDFDADNRVTELRAR